MIEICIVLLALNLGISVLIYLRLGRVLTDANTGPGVPPVRRAAGSKEVQEIRAVLREHGGGK